MFNSGPEMVRFISLNIISVFYVVLFGRDESEAERTSGFLGAIVMVQGRDYAALEYGSGDGDAET